MKNERVKRGRRGEVGSVGECERREIIENRADNHITDHISVAKKR